MGSVNAAGSWSGRSAGTRAPAGRSCFITPAVLVRLGPAKPAGYAVAIEFYHLGTGGAGTPLNGLAVDQYGLAYALGSHQVGDPNGRPGHTKWVIPAWIVAEYSDVAQAPGIPAAQLAAARKALSCGTLAELDQATQAPLTASRFAIELPSLTDPDRFPLPPCPGPREGTLPLGTSLAGAPRACRPPEPSTG